MTAITSALARSPLQSMASLLLMGLKKVTGDHGSAGDAQASSPVESRPMATVAGHHGEENIADQAQRRPRLLGLAGPFATNRIQRLLRLPHIGFDQPVPHDGVCTHLVAEALARHRG